MIGATTTADGALFDLIVVVLSVVVAIVAYRVSESFKAANGVTPWRLPSWLWAVFGLLSILICIILLAIARRTTKPLVTGTPTGARELFDAGPPPLAPHAVEAPTPVPDGPPFGWYTDPSGRHQLRYWDGMRWSEHVSDQGVSSIDHP